MYTTVESRESSEGQLAGMQRSGYARKHLVKKEGMSRIYWLLQAFDDGGNKALGNETSISCHCSNSF